MKWLLAAAGAAAMICSSCANSRMEAAAITSGGNPWNGQDKIAYYGCGSCHTIPGINNANGLVGPPLTGMGSRVYIAGVLTNDSTQMARWIRNPKAVDPLTAMPNLHVTPADARDIASYLASLR